MKRNSTSTARPLRTLPVILVSAWPLFCVVGPASAQSLSDVELGRDGGSGGLTGAATGANATGGNATGADASGPARATGGDAAGGAARGGDSRSGDANGADGAATSAVRLETRDRLLTTADADRAIVVIRSAGAGGAGGTTGSATGGNAAGGDATGGNATADGLAIGGDGVGGAALGGTALSGSAAGGIGGSTGAISVINATSIETAGVRAHAISVESRGGTGGAGGASGSATGGDAIGGGGIGGSASAGPSGRAQGGDGTGGTSQGGGATSGSVAGGAGGSSGTVSIGNHGRIVTSGDTAHGIRAVSMRGEGGSGGLAGATSAGSGTGGAGLGGVATGGSAANGVAANGAAAPGGATSGASAFGINGTTGAILIDSDGDILASGAGSHAIMAESTGGLARINLSGGNVSGGTASGAGIFLSGAEASVSIAAGARLSSAASLAVWAPSGSVAIASAGTVVGDVMLALPGRFDNLAGGRFKTGATVDLGGGLLRNAGTLSPGGDGVVLRSAVGGQMIQDSQGTLLLDADFGRAQADRLDVSGAVVLDGSARVSLLGLQDGGALRVIDAGGGLDVAAGFSVLDTPVVTYSFIQGAGSLDVVLDGIAFDASGLGGNRSAIASTLQATYRFGPGALDGVLLALANTPTLAGYNGALDAIGAEPYLAAVETFADDGPALARRSLRECGWSARAYTDGSSCVWGGIEAGLNDADGNRDQIGFDAESLALTIGYTSTVSSEWTVSGAVAIERTDLDTGTGSRIEIEQASASLAVLRKEGAFSLGLGFAAGYGGMDVARSSRIGALDFAANSDGNLAYATALARIAYDFDVAGNTLTPRLDLDATYLRSDAVQEGGAGPLNLTVGDVDETLVAIRPAIELSRVGTVGAWTVRGAVAGGIAWRPGNDLELAAQFQDAPAGAPSFSVTQDIDEVIAEAEATLRLENMTGTAIGLGYRFQGGEDDRWHSVSASIGLRF